MVKRKDIKVQKCIFKIKQPQQESINVGQGKRGVGVKPKHGIQKLHYILI